MNFSGKQKKKWLSKIQFIFDYVDTSEVSGQTYSDCFDKGEDHENYRRSRKLRNPVVTGDKRAGIKRKYSAKESANVV